MDIKNACPQAGKSSGGEGQLGRNFSLNISLFTVFFKLTITANKRYLLCASQTIFHLNCRPTFNLSCAGEVAHE